MTSNVRTPASASRAISSSGGTPVAPDRQASPTASPVSDVDGDGDRFRTVGRHGLPDEIRVAERGRAEDDPPRSGPSTASTSAAGADPAGRLDRAVSPTAAAISLSAAS